jgi:hypothetical protein
LNLRNLNFRITVVVVIVGEPNHSIGADHQSVVILAIRNLGDALELATLDDAVPVHNA